MRAGVVFVCVVFWGSLFCVMVGLLFMYVLFVFYICWFCFYDYVFVDSMNICCVFVYLCVRFGF